MGNVELDTCLLHSDLAQLKEIGQRNGFPARLRRKIWMILLELEGSYNSEQDADMTTRAPHPDEKQVHLDTLRSFNSALPESLAKDSIPKLRTKVEHLITQVLRRNCWLHYYQGYHDIAQTMLLVLGSSALPAMEKLSLIYLRDFMLSSLLPSMSTLRLTHQIIGIADPEYAHILSGTEPYYAISALLTWWTHSIELYSDACRVMDFLLSSPPYMIVYTLSAAALARREEVLKLSGEDDMIFLCLSRGLTDLDLESILASSLNLHENIKPRQLSYWKQISKHSCFKPAVVPVGSSEWRNDAQAHFLAHEAEVLEQVKKQNKTPTTKGLGPSKKLGLLALSVGVLAVGIAWLVQQKSNL